MNKVLRIDINEDKKCKQCGKGGACQNGLCLKCIAKKMIYAVSLIIQKAEVEAYCFGSCQKLMLSGFDKGDKYGPFVLCREEACEFEAGKTPVIGQAFGNDVCVRRLRPLGRVRLNDRTIQKVRLLQRSLHRLRWLP